MTGVFNRRETETQAHTGRMPCGEGDLEWCTLGQRMPRVASIRQKAGEKQEADSLSESLVGTNPAHTLIPDFQLPEQRENKFLLFKATPFMATAGTRNEYSKGVTVLSFLPSLPQTSSQQKRSGSVFLLQDSEQGLGSEVCEGTNHHHQEVGPPCIQSCYMPGSV